MSLNTQGRQYTLGYDPTSGLLHTVTDPTNRVVTYTDDANGNLTNVSGPYGNFTYGYGVSEIIGLRSRDVLLDRQVAVHLRGKGRNERVIPLWRTTARELRRWLPQIPQGADMPVFPNRAGTPMTRSGVRDRLDRALRVATQRCPSLQGRPISAHTLRHTCAMHLLQSGVDLAVIALWLGHSDPATTHGYLEADLATKEAALQRLDSPEIRPARYRPGDKLLAFLDAL